VRLDNLAARLALYVELYAIMLLLSLPFNKFGPYSRELLERQVIGSRYLLSGGMRIPEEVERHYSRTGKFIIVIVLFNLVQWLVDIVVTAVRW
jgi:hypothetical protein